jgi:hypothetical protein
MWRLQTYGWVRGLQDSKAWFWGIKFHQKVLLQSYRDEFGIRSLKKFNTLAAPGTVLKKPVEGDDVLTPAKQT